MTLKLWHCSPFHLVLPSIQINASVVGLTILFLNMFLKQFILEKIPLLQHLNMEMRNAMARREMCANLGSPAASLYCCKWVQYLTVKSSGTVIKFIWRSPLFVASTSLIENFKIIFYNSQDISQGLFWKIKSQRKSHQPWKFPRSWDKIPSLATLIGLLIMLSYYLS